MFDSIIGYYSEYADRKCWISFLTIQVHPAFGSLNVIKRNIAINLIYLLVSPTEYFEEPIFMNAVGIQHDVQTLLHESGHALHAFARREEKIAQYKNSPHEVNEVSSVSMELFTLDYLDEFYNNKEDMKMAKREQLESAISTFPMVAVVDALQRWIYLNPNHTSEERDGEFAKLKDRFGVVSDWSGLEKEKEIGWLKTRHIFEVPFYYIEYAIAQLGAIALYKEYKENPKQAIENYKRFMALGYSKSVPEIYAAAGIKFDFSKEYLQEMVDFVMEELEKAE